MKERMYDKFTTKKTDVEILRKAVVLKYERVKIKVFFVKADKLYTQAKFDF